jgi:hypothetical protein
MTSQTVRAALDELADAVANERCSVVALATVVLALEESAGAPLGETGTEPLIVLQRRFARAHRRLRDGAISSGEVLGHLTALQSRGQVVVPPQRASAPDGGTEPPGLRQAGGPAGERRTAVAPAPPEQRVGGVDGDVVGSGDRGR